MGYEEPAGPPAARRPVITCVGALVVDLTFWAPRRPNPGETLIGDRFEEFLGGKGFNQAIAAARLGASVHLVGAVGEDAYGDRFVTALEEAGVATAHVARVTEGTGVGSPVVTSDGEVAILGIPRANHRLDATMIDAARNVITAADLLMLQCEVPLPANLRAAEIAREHGVTVMLNPAPAGPQAQALAPFADLLILNEIESRMIIGREDGTPAELVQAVSDAASCTVVLTLGSKGAMVSADGAVYDVPAHEVRSVDPTGAGDAFCAAYAVASAQGRPPGEALQRANAAGAVAVQVAGAEPSMPTAAAVDELLGADVPPRIAVTPLR